MNTATGIHDLLRLSGHNACYGNDKLRAPMIWGLWEQLLTEAKARRERLQLEGGELDRQRRENDDASEKKRSRARADDLLTLLNISEAIRRELRDLQSDIETAIVATRHAFARASLIRDRAFETLEDAQRNAMALGNGKRVYFARDGSLHGESGDVIVDEDSIEEARLLLTRSPQATTYEVFIARKNAVLAADAQVHQIAELLDRLDSLRTETASGLTPPEEIRAKRGELDRIIGELPTDAQEEFDRLRHARDTFGEAPYVQADNSDSHIQNEEFGRAQSTSEDALSKQETAPFRSPLYKGVPDF